MARQSAQRGGLYNLTAGALTLPIITAADFTVDSNLLHLTVILVVLVSPPSLPPLVVS